jgi:tRNA modification GTPase
MHNADTIVALSTPPGRSGIGVIRLSGKGALSYLSALLGDETFDPEPKRVSLKTIRDPESHEILDRALVTYFKSPHSFTGEDVVEISCHGSPPLLLRVIDLLLSLGARAADPGEFTLRAVSHGRLDLSQAEGIRDLINAQTYAAVRHAARQLGGELSTLLQPIKDDIVKIIVPLESSIEFVEDDLPEDITHEINQKLTHLIQKLEQLSNTFFKGRLLKDGLRVTFVGRPNVGKSSLFNKLLASDRAIVTNIPGTTRDTLSEVISINDVPVLLIDTAGVRTSNDIIEQLGIERTRQAIADADVVVVVLDASQPFTSEDKEIIEETVNCRHVIALNKCDLEVYSHDIAKFLGNDSPVVEVSAKTGAGINILSNDIIRPFSVYDQQDTSFIISSARHYDLLRRSVDSLRLSQQELEKRAGEELVLIGLYDSLRYLGDITGETTSEDVLTQIFMTFCIGK